MGLLHSADELGAYDVRLGHRWVFTIERIESDLTKAGLKIMRSGGWFTKPLPQAMMTEYSDALLEGLMKLGDELPREYACFLAFDCQRSC
jgi:hypothetical protein